MHARNLTSLVSDPGLVAITKKVRLKQCLEKKLRQQQLNSQINTQVTVEERRILLTGRVAEMRVRNYAEELIKAMNKHPNFDEKNDQQKPKKCFTCSKV